MRLAPITVFGAGRVGLVTAACFAELGHAVVCIDRSVPRIAQLQRAQLPFHEPDLATLVARQVDTGRLRFTSDPDDAVAHGRVVFIAVGTPADDDGSADVEQVLDVARELGERAVRELLVVTRSTVPVGTGARIEQTIRAELARRSLAELRIDVVSNPAFLREGHAARDFLDPERVVVGADDDVSLNAMLGLYGPLLRRAGQWLPMRRRSAELTPYACDALRAARLSTLNELALLAEQLHTDMDEVCRGIAADAHHDASAPACGIGGACLSRELRALQRSALEVDLPLQMPAAAEQVIERLKAGFGARVVEAFGGRLAGRRVALWGLASQPGSDELREAPSEAVIAALLQAGAQVVVHDPLALPAARERHARQPALQFADDPLAAVDAADALVITTAWPQFRRADWPQVQRRMNEPRVFDGCNVCDPARMAALGFVYCGIGRNGAEKVAATTRLAIAAALEAGKHTATLPAV
jgi:UDPglucose 6-dehydrogenase